MENRFEARRSRASLFLSAAREEAIAGVSIGGGVSGGGEVRVSDPSARESIASSEGASTTTEGAVVELGRSTSEYLFREAGARWRGGGGPGVDVSARVASASVVGASVACGVDERERVGDGRRAAPKPLTGDAAGDGSGRVDGIGEVSENRFGANPPTKRGGSEVGGGGGGCSGKSLLLEVRFEGPVWLLRVVVSAGVSGGIARAELALEWEDREETRLSRSCADPPDEVDVEERCLLWDAT